MSEDFVINTSENIFKEQSYEPYGFLPEIHPMLRQTIPNCDMILPNTQMDTLIHRLHKTMKLRVALVYLQINVV